MLHAFVVSIVLFIIFVLLRTLNLLMILIFTSTNMHNKMTESVMRAKILFYDSNPSGRIISRFSKDIGIIDNIMPFQALYMI